MTNKFIDLIAFNETRLDPNITGLAWMTMMLSERTDQEMGEGFVFTYVAPSITK